MTEGRIAVIGAGPAGLAAARALSERGADVDVFERDGMVGGLSRSFSLWGRTVDLGPHRFFSKDIRVNRAWLRDAGSDYRMVDRLTRIFYRGKFFRYPLQPADALRNLGIADSAACLASYLKEKALPSRQASPDSFEAWVVGRFGRRLYERFFKSYTEKLWGIPCGELDRDFAAQRIKKFSLGEAVKSAMGIGGGKHATLVDRFAYPHGGSGMIYERMADAVRRLGGHVHTGCAVRRLAADGSRIVAIELEDGRTVPVSRIISTMPLPHLVRGVGPVPPAVAEALEKLRYRNTIFAYFLVRRGDLFRDQWLYIHSPELATGRITNFENWVPEIRGDPGSTVVALESWSQDSDQRWGEDDGSIAVSAEAELRATGLIGDAPIAASKVIRVPLSYPIYERGYRERLAVVVDHLKRYENLTAIGRGGAFKYNNQDHSILMGLLAAENIADGAAHDLWAVNADDEYHEEAIISETGLAPCDGASGAARQASGG
jgi:protoporphyrinogen oxidase